MPTSGNTSGIMNIREALKEGISILKSADIEAPVVDAGVVLCHVLKRDKSFLYSHPEHVLTDEEYGRYIELIGKRASGMPVQYITGHREFMSLDFVVSPDVLIPRQDTEILVETVLEYARERRKELTGKQAGMQGNKRAGSQASWQAAKQAGKRADMQAGRQAERQADSGGGGCLSILDIGTGSGCIAVSLAYYLEDCHVTASDLSEKALEVARINAVKNGVAEKIKFIKSDLFEALRKGKSSCPFDTSCAFDIIVSNPPYIAAAELMHLQREVRDYEPMAALDGGEDGLDFYRAIVREAVEFLKPGGLLAFEVGIGQAGYVSRLMEESFCNIKTVRDFGRIDRVVAGTLRP